MNTFFATFLTFSLSIAANATDYSNSAGCTAEVDQRANGVQIYLHARNGQQAFLGFLNNLSSGDIQAFCSPARVHAQGQTITLECEKSNSGSNYQTRGYAVIEFQKDMKTLKSVKVKGEVQQLFGWKVDTNITCENLR
ncbi:MAG: hypothetical protein KBD76_14040 [Bacteriovorax sp.]|nr:hypothetical protein [Bacteriovorax sp.]